MISEETITVGTKNNRKLNDCMLCYLVTAQKRLKRILTKEAPYRGT